MTATAKPRPARLRARQRFDERKYGRLLARTVPAVIRNDAECRRVEAEIANLLRKGERLTPEEERLLDLLSALVERYEDETEDFPDSPPHRILQFLMEQNDLQQVDLVKIFGSSGRVSAGSQRQARDQQSSGEGAGRIFQSVAGIVHLMSLTKSTSRGSRVVMTPRSGWWHSKERTRKKGANQGIVSMTKLAACQSASSSEGRAGAEP